MDLNNRKSIVAITVTFNSSHYVIRAVDALLGQSQYVDQIIVVDNNSKKEEKEKLVQYLDMVDRAEMIVLPENLGGAGGFQAGMEYAREHYDPEWYWLMDDDAFPRTDCLENLLKHGQEGIGCLVPLIWGVDKKEYQLYHHKRENKYLTRDIQVVKNVMELEEKKEIEASAFVGPLISKQAVDLVGVADGSLFIYGDDLEYIYRISRKFHVYLIKSAVINHQDILTTGNIINPKAWWKDYYMYRNRLFFIQKFGKGAWRKLIGKTIFAGMLFKRVIFAAVQPEYQGYRKLRLSLIWKAWQDGLHNRRGKIIDPVRYQRELDDRRK